jgi:hypothetical protein
MKPGVADDLDETSVHQCPDDLARPALADATRSCAATGPPSRAGTRPAWCSSGCERSRLTGPAAERDLVAQDGAATLSEDEIRALVRYVRKGLRGLASATAETRQATYASMGLRLMYHPAEDAIIIEVPPDACTGLRVGGGT